ncbi:MAG: hypothetical protein NZ789_15305, partial [Pseudomonadales bacterium]|nr:hypothetical protein [Pseudomonadales bacterium]
MMILLYFSLKVADVSLSESGHLVPWRLTPHTSLQSPLFSISGKPSTFAYDVSNAIFEYLS